MTSLTRRNASTYISNFELEGISFLETLSETIISKLLIYANKQYYNDIPVLMDNQYDILKEYIEETYPNNKVVKQVGAPVERNKVTLPYNMPSMDKIKPDTGVLTRWKNKYDGPYIISVKLDGVSGMYTTEGEKPKLYTRGNGTVGQDVSNLIPYLKLPEEKNITIRGEFIMKKEVFETYYKNSAANPRNLISGLINSKNADKEKYSHIDFVAYEVIHPKMRPSYQMKTLDSMNVENVQYEATDTITNEFLSDTLVSWRNDYLYEMDGVIVINNRIYPRENKNPEHAFAFKMVLSDQMAEAKVVDVIWTPSKDGYIKPRVRIEPIQLGGVRIEYATGFNAAYIKNNKIGVGAIIKLIRSGDVIPHIMETIVPSTTVKMPDVPYKWTKTKVDIMLKNPNDNSVVQEKNITYFFTKLGVVGLSLGNVCRLIEAGYNSVQKILFMKKDDFLDVEGFQDKMAHKLYTSIHEKVKKATLPELMVASNVFGHGIGMRKVKAILEEYPNVLVSEEGYEEKFDHLIDIESIADKTAEYFLDNIDEFVEFMYSIKKQNKLDYSDSIQEKNCSHTLFNKTIVMTGFRNRELEQTVHNCGAKVSGSVSKNTFVLLVKDPNETTSKIEKARSYGIPIMNVSQFKKKYL